MATKFETDTDRHAWRAAFAAILANPEVLLANLEALNRNQYEKWIDECAKLADEALEQERKRRK
jgi:hypothetical protein